jgi:hypothetical protein
MDLVLSVSELRLSAIQVECSVYCWLTYGVEIRRSSMSVRTPFKNLIKNNSVGRGFLSVLRQQFVYQS